MKVVVLASGAGGRVIAELPDDATKHTESFLETDLARLSASGKPHRKAAAGMLALFDAIATLGRKGGSRFFHEANKSLDVYSFRKCDLRVYFSFDSDGGEIYLCSHAIVKQGQKAKVADSERAADFKKRLTAARLKGQLEYIDRKKKNDD